MNNLKQVLKQKGIQQKWLAEQLGITNQTVNNWCQNTHQPSLKRLIEIAEILNFELKELI